MPCGSFTEGVPVRSEVENEDLDVRLRSVLSEQEYEELREIVLHVLVCPLMILTEDA